MYTRYLNDMSTQSATTVRISCTCATCKANAAKVGATFPLRADVPAALAKTVGSKTHNLVFDAHNPSAIGQVMRKNLGIRPVA